MPKDPPPGADPTAERVARARDRLVAERDEALDRLRHLEADVAAMIDASQGSNADDEHDPEGATIAYERARADALAQQAARRLVEVTAAIGRVDAGTYGTCQVCGRPIPWDRLDARPTASTHVGCADAP